MLMAPWHDDIRGNVPTPEQQTRAQRVGHNIWKEARRAEQRYAHTLRNLATQVGHFIEGSEAETVYDTFKLGMLLQHYAEAITPWAESVAKRMVAEVNARNKLTWRKATNNMSMEMSRIAHSEPTEQLMRELLARQVTYIKSIPGEAALKIQELGRIHEEITIPAVVEGSRPERLEDAVKRIATWTGNRPRLIARTEVARTQEVLTEARARRIDSPGYYWVSARDFNVREDHVRLDRESRNGTIFSWDDPPVAEKSGERHHPGCFPNCFTGDTPISLGNGFLGVWRAPFDGRVIDIRTDAGLVSPTLNHPIFTNRGWMAAGEINEGDYLVQALDDAHIISEGDTNNLLPTFEQVFTALRLLVNECGVAFGANFYGDIPNGEVDYIGLQHLLMNNRVAKSFETDDNFLFSRANGNIRGAFSGVSGEVLDASFAGVGAENFTFIGSHALHADEIGFTTSSWFNAVSKYDSPDDIARDTMPCGDGQFTFACQIGGDNFTFGQNGAVGRGASRAFDHDSATPELLAQFVGVAKPSRGFFQCGSRLYQFLRVVEKGIRNFAGHVYTMETRSGWYSAGSNGMSIAKNCRCIAVPVINDRWAR